MAAHAPRAEPMRASTPEQRLALKAALRRALKLSGGAASFQHATRLCESDLSRCAAPDHLDRHAPVDVALDADLEAGSPVMASALAAAQGFRLVRMEDGGGTLTVGDLGQLARECGEAVNAVAIAMGAGGHDERTLREVHRELEEAVAALRRVQACVPLPGSRGL